MQNHTTKFEPGTLQQALQRGYDVAQLKHAGEPVSVFISQGEMKVYSATSIKDLLETHKVPNRLMFQLVGTRSPAGLVIIHDCLGTELMPEREYYRLNNTSYRDRYTIARSAVKQINQPTLLTIVQNYPIDQAGLLWPIVEQQSAKGLIFRKSEDKPYGVVLIQRFYPDLVQHLKA